MVQSQPQPAAVSVSSASGRKAPALRWSCTPLVSLSKTTVECRVTDPHSLRPCSDSKNGSDRPQPSAPSLSSNSSSFFDIQSFPSTVSFCNPRNEFEQLFSILPDLCEPTLSSSALASSYQSRIFIDCEDHEDSGLDVPPTLVQKSFTAPPALLMNLRKFVSPTSNNADSESRPRPRSFASRLLHAGFGSHGSDEANDSSSPSSHEEDPGALMSSVSTVNTIPRQHPADQPSADSSQFGSASVDSQEVTDTPLSIAGSNGLANTSPPQLNSYPSSLHRPVTLLGRNSDTPKVLTATIAEQASSSRFILRPLFPVQQRLSKSWRLVYSMDQQGISMNTMLSLCASQKEILLAIKDTKGRVFGAFLNEPLRLSPTFYGQGTCFLWKAYRSSPQSRKKDAVKRFKYTGENEYFILCDPDFVAIGGGRGKFGLWFKSDFLHGYSACCPTFNNEPLCLDPSSAKNKDPEAQKEFVVGHLEIWAFNP
ncbi:oxidation resistance protein 1 [Coemansia sp. RSA 1722]|nr:oxidation resistance protein 1 [Coemansia sp. RSA 485]KAJ2606285.1 oxidation resistance protein 1 [Coemansia sp. RSA 1722]